MRNAVVVLLIVSLVACGSGGGQLAAAAQTAVSYLANQVPSLGAFVERLLDLIPVILDPGQHAQNGITLQEGPNPNEFTYDIPVDRDGDGNNDTTVAGTATFNRDPRTGNVLGLMGSIDTTITADDGTIVELMLDFEVTLLGIVISGTGTFDDPTNGYSGEATVSPGDPLTVRPADGGVMNLCTLSAEGNVNTEIMGPDSWYTGVFQFDFGSPTATITNAAQGPDEQSAEPVADSSVDLGCRPSLQDWVGTFDMNYVCPPGGGGQETHTFVVTGPNTLQVSKAPAGGGAPTVFTATADPDDPHTVRGEFTEADSEGTYTEVFVYTLTPDGSVFTQDNEFTYIDGPSQGLGGPCFGTAKKR